MLKSCPKHGGVFNPRCLDCYESERALLREELRAVRSAENLKIKALEEDLGANKAVAVALQKEIKSLKDDLADAREGGRKIAKSYEIAAKRAEKMKDERDTLNAEVHKWRDRANELADKSDTMKAEVERLREEVHHAKALLECASQTGLLDKNKEK